MKKYKILILIMFFLSIFVFEKVNASFKDLPLLGKIIYLDAGHGGYLYTRCNKTSEKAL